MYIGREYQKYILSYLDFTRLCNVISRFPELNIDILKEGISFPLLYVSRYCKQIKTVLTNLHKYVNQIDIVTYGDYTITKIYFGQDCSFQRATEMIITCTSIFERQHKQIGKILIIFCKNSTDRYNLNILRIIKIIYQIFIQCEWYNLAYTKKQDILVEQ